MELREEISFSDGNNVQYIPLLSILLSMAVVTVMRN
jgi:hypothetical protein